MQAFLAEPAEGSRLFAADEQLLTEQLVVVFRHSEEIGDDQHRERLRVVGDELARTATHELGELLVGEAPHELLVLLQALGRDQTHEEGAMRGVLGRVERGELVGERELVAVRVDLRGDVVARQWYREAGERSGHRVARREAGGVVVNRDCFVVPGDHDDVVVPFALYRALRAQVLVVRVRIGDELVALEEVGRVEVKHGVRSL